MRRIIIILLSLVCISGYSQTVGGRYDFNFDARRIWSKGSSAGVKSLKLDKRLFNIRFDKGRKGIFSSRLNYSFARITFDEQALHFTDLEKFHNIGLNLNYVRRINQNWGFFGSAMPQLKSNFAENLKGDDFYITAFALFTYSKNKDRRFSFGLAYISTLGFPAPIPVFMYWINLNIKWNITIGFPRLNFEYDIDKKSRLSIYAELEGFNSNLSKDLSHPNFKDEKLAQKLSYRDIITGLEYNYHIKEFSIRVNCGYTLNRNFALQDNNYKKVYGYDMKNNLNIGLGFGVSF